VFNVAWNREEDFSTSFLALNLIDLPFALIHCSLLHELNLGAVHATFMRFSLLQVLEALVGC
jgi:hypothetical protein